jgi:hypothetical protein
MRDGDAATAERRGVLDSLDKTLRRPVAVFRCGSSARLDRRVEPKHSRVAAHINLRMDTSRFRGRIPCSALRMVINELGIRE